MVFQPTIIFLVHENLRGGRELVGIFCRSAPIVVVHTPCGCGRCVCVGGGLCVSGGGGCVCVGGGAVCVCVGGLCVCVGGGAVCVWGGGCVCRPVSPQGGLLWSVSNGYR